MELGFIDDTLDGTWVEDTSPFQVASEEKLLTIVATLLSQEIPIINW